MSQNVTTQHHKKSFQINLEMNNFQQFLFVNRNTQYVTHGQMKREYSSPLQSTLSSTNMAIVCTTIFPHVIVRWQQIRALSTKFNHNRSNAIGIDQPRNSQLKVTNFRAPIHPR